MTDRGRDRAADRPAPAWPLEELSRLFEGAPLPVDWSVERWLDRLVPPREGA